MGKKKAEKPLDFPKVSSRKAPFITVTHKLKNSGAEIKISAKPEDWRKLEYYILNAFDKSRLWDDFFSIIRAGVYYATPKTRGQHKKQFVIDTLKVYAAILFNLLSKIKATKQYPAFLKNIHTSALWRHEAGFFIAIF